MIYYPNSFFTRFSFTEHRENKRKRLAGCITSTGKDTQLFGDQTNSKSSGFMCRFFLFFSSKVFRGRLLAQTKSQQKLSEKKDFFFMILGAERKFPKVATTFFHMFFYISIFLSFLFSKSTCAHQKHLMEKKKKKAEKGS